MARRTCQGVPQSQVGQLDHKKKARCSKSREDKLEICEQLAGPIHASVVLCGRMSRKTRESPKVTCTLFCDHVRGAVLSNCNLPILAWCTVYQSQPPDLCPEELSSNITWRGPLMGYPQIIHFNRIFPYHIINHPFWGTPLYGNHHLSLWKGPVQTAVPKTCQRVKPVNMQIWAKSSRLCLNSPNSSL